MTRGKSRNGDVGDGDGGSNCIGTLTPSLRVGSEASWTRDHVWKVLLTVVMLKNVSDITSHLGLLRSEEEPSRKQNYLLEAGPLVAQVSPAR